MNIRTLINRLQGNDVPYTDHLTLRAEYEDLKIRYADLQKKVLFQSANHRDVPVAGFDDLRVEPEKDKDSKQYIADVQVFFENIFHRKLKVSIAEVRELLSNIGRQEGTPLSMSRTEYDMFLRGMEAAFWKIHDWAIDLDAETKQPLQDKETEETNYGSI